MINCSSSVDRDIPSDSSVMENTDASALNEANAGQDRDGAYGATSDGTPFMSAEKSTTTIAKPYRKPPVVIVRNPKFRRATRRKGITND